MINALSGRLWAAGKGIDHETPGDDQRDERLREEPAGRDSPIRGQAGVPD